MALDNVKQIYDVIYDEMVEAKIAEKLDSPVLMDQKEKLLRRLDNL